MMSHSLGKSWEAGKYLEGGTLPSESGKEIPINGKLVISQTAFCTD